jgi:hypothetical protein
VVDKDTGHVPNHAAGIDRLTGIIVTIRAAILPLVTVRALNSLETTHHRMYLTVLQLFSQAFFSQPKRVEILVADATRVVEPVNMPYITDAGLLGSAGL